MIQIVRNWKNTDIENEMKKLMKVINTFKVMVKMKITNANHMFCVIILLNLC